MPYRNRHGFPNLSSPPTRRYNPETWKEYQDTTLERDEEDEARLEALKQRLKQDGSDALDQADKEVWDDIMAKKDDRVEARCAPMRREVEGYFELPPLPAPLPRSSLWLGVTRPCHYTPEEVRPFYVACEEGRLDEVRGWMGRKDVLRPIGLRDGLDCAAIGNQVHVARYLLDEGVALHGHAVKAACKNRSLQLFELFVAYGYHPNQQVPSYHGGFGTALRHCLDREPVARFLLEAGADPNAAPFTDRRNMVYDGERVTAPVDRTSGLPLDIAVEQSSFAVVQMLLEHGADPKFSRPLGGVMSDRATGRAENEWRPLMEMLLRYGTDVNGRTWTGGTALTVAVRKERWDVVELLLERGADPRTKTLSTKKDSFEVAAKRAGMEWEGSEGLRGYLDYLCGEGGRDTDGPAPDGAERNPLVQVMERFKVEEEGGAKDRPGRTRNENMRL